MEYDRHVAILQGSILGFGKEPLSEKEKCARLSKVLESLSSKNKIISRKIFMCLLLNTDLKELEQLREIPEYAPLSDLFRISAETFIKLLNDEMWLCFLEAMPCTIPMDIVEIFIGLLVIPESITHAKPNNDNYMRIFPLIVAILLKIRLNNNYKLGDLEIAMVSKLLEYFRNIKSEDQIFGTLFLLRTACAKDKDILQKTLSGSVSFHSDLSIPMITSERKEFPQQLFENILTIYLAIAKEVTLDSWIDLAEVKTETIAARFPAITIWDTNDYLPSNLQMILAHYSFQVLEYVTERNMNLPDAKQILSTFSKQYNRICELQLDTMNIDDILGQLTEFTEAKFSPCDENNNDWKKAAYSQHLLAKMWGDVMGKTKVLSESNVIKGLQTLSKNATFLIDYCDKLYAELVLSNLKNLLWETKLNLFFAVFKHLSLEKSRRILDARLKDHGVHSPIFLNSQAFLHDIRHFLNKIVIKDNNMLSDDLIVEMNLLILQSPKEVIYYLIQEGLENKGKIDVVSKVLSSLPKSAIRHPVDTSSGECMLITSALMLKLIVVRESTAEDEINNLQQILQKLFQSDGEIGKNFALHLIRNDKIMFVIQNLKVLHLAFEAIEIEALNSIEKTVFMICFCQIASTIYETRTTDQIHNELELALEILSTFAKDPIAGQQLRVNIIPNFLHDNLHGYFLGNTSASLGLREILKSMYFKAEKVEYPPCNGLQLEMTACLPHLLPNEWNILGHRIYVSGEKIELSFLLDCVQILISSAALDNRQLEYVLQSIGKLISARIQDITINKEHMENRVPWLRNLQTKLSQVIGKK